MSTTTTPARQIAQRIAGEQHELFIAAEQACLAIADGELQSVDHDLIFKALKWDNREVRKHVARIVRVKHQLAQAGTPEALAAAQRRAVALPGQHTAEREQLISEQKRIEARLNEMNNLERAAVADLERRQTAVETLRKLIPPHIEMELRRCEKNLSTGLRKEVNAAESRVRHLRSVLAVDPSDAKSVNTFVELRSLTGDPAERACIVFPPEPDPVQERTIDPSLAHTMPPRQPPPTLDRAKFTALCERHRAELQGLEPQLAEMQQELTEAEAEIGLLRDHYHSGDGRRLFEEPNTETTSVG